MVARLTIHVNRPNVRCGRELGHAAPASLCLTDGLILIAGSSPCQHDAPATEPQHSTRCTGMATGRTGPHRMIMPEDVRETSEELPSQAQAESTLNASDMGELPQQFHERLSQLLGSFPGATLASVQPGRQRGSWAAELLFHDRRETFVVNYLPDQPAT